MGKFPYNNRMFSVLVFFAVLSLLLDIPSSSASIRVFTGKTAHALPVGVERFIRLCDREVSKILPREPGGRKIDYTIVAIDAKQLKSKCRVSRTSFKKLRVFLSDDIGDLKNHPSLLAKLAAWIILKKAGVSRGKGYRNIPRWIVYGVLRKAIRKTRRRRTPGMVVYPGAHALVLSGKLPDLMSVVDHPPSPNDGPSFKLAMEISEITLNSVLRLPKGKKLLEDIINLSFKGASPGKSFRVALKDSIPALGRPPVDGAVYGKRDVFSEWLADAVLRSAVNIFNPLDASSAERMFLEYGKVKYATKPFATSTGIERPSEMRCRVLRDIADELGKMENPKLVIVAKQRDFALLMMMMPDGLQEPLGRMRSALSLLVREQPDAFKKNMAAAEADFYNALDKKQRIEAFVGKIERSVVPPALLYAPQLGEIDRGLRARRRLWPRLHSFLDSKEKSFGQ